MNKLNKLFAGFAAVAMLAACSNDEPNAPTAPEKPEGDLAYLTVTISAPQSGSRATEDGGYIESDAVEKEHKVTDVQFFFFDKNGGYTGLRAASSDYTFVPANDKEHNIEYIGSQNIVVLEGLKGTDYPEYVITVLNAPDFRAAATMQETADALDKYATNMANSSPDKFVMTTSSFFGEKTVVDNTEGASIVRHDDTYYYATKLVTSDFKLTRDEAAKTKNPVDIYVERLAAKVQVAFAKAGEDENHPGYYKIETTLAGGNNVTDGDNVADVDLWVKVKGWTLNALAEESYMSKKLESSWKETGTLWNSWNNAGDWRSFWAKSQTYTENPSLYYHTPKDMVAKLKTAGFTSEDETTYYCYENTNEPKNIFEPIANGSLSLVDGTKVGVNLGKVTHAIIYTQIVTFDKDGKEQPLSLVQYRGLLFLQDSYLALILNNIKSGANGLNFWKVTSGEANKDGAQYEQVGINDLVVTRAYETSGTTLSEIKVSVNSEIGQLYSREWKEAVGKEGEEGYVAAHYEYTVVPTSELEALVAAEQAGENKAIGADEGEAIYKVPIEHLAAKATETYTETKAVEGYYGVVRNHWYQLTIKNFKKVGYLLYDPDTDETKIIPDGPEDPLYYVGAKINILSWKVVNQTVTDL